MPLTPEQIAVQRCYVTLRGALFSLPMNARSTDEAAFVHCATPQKTASFGLCRLPYKRAPSARNERGS
jgi:hypothetical protein